MTQKMLWPLKKLLNYKIIEKISTFDSVEASEMAVVNCRDKPKKKKKGHEENREKEVVTTYAYLVIKTEEDYISTITEMSTEEVIM